MKRVWFTCIIFLLCGFIYAQDLTFVKIMDIQQGKNENSIYLRNEDEVYPQDDQTGNYIIFSDEGNCYIQGYDTNDVKIIDLSKKNVSQLFKTQFLNYKYEYVRSVSDNKFLLADHNSRFEYYDFDKNELIFKVILFDMGMRIESQSVYYDKESNILFFMDSKNAIHCVVNPDLDNEQNKKNYKNPEETIALLKTGVYGPHLSLFKEKFLMVDNHTYYWSGYTINDINYQLFSDKGRIVVWLPTGKLAANFKDENNIEIVESMALHPSGDCYILRYNTKTNMHILYCVENTWDPKWRKEWYKKHK